MKEATICRLAVPLLFLSIAPAVVMSAQDAVKDPHQRPPVVVVDNLMQVDDMLLASEQLNRPDVFRRQAAVTDMRSANGYWDFGVIPYQISTDFTAAQQANIRLAIAGWMSAVPVVFVPRTNEVGYLDITKGPAGTVPSPCFSSVGQFRRGTRVVTNLGDNCADSLRTAYHELGHLLGLFHEQSRADRDDFVEIDLTNVAENARYAFNKITFPVVGSYDFGSIMHYGDRAFAIDSAKPVIIPRPGYQSFATMMGRATSPSRADYDGLAFLYSAQLRASTITRPTQPSLRTFSRDEFILAMERLNALYMSRYGLQRPAGLSLNGAPDFLGIAQWIFDIYLGARSAGWSVDGAFDIVTAAVTQTDEWKQKNPTRTSLTPPPYQPSLVFDRNEFVSIMNRLDAFYRAPEGLRRPNGLALNGGPDFIGIATWVFDIYLAERLRGISPTAAWTLTENAIKATDEWRSKH
jgi:hypothetical protein